MFIYFKSLTQFIYNIFNIRSIKFFIQRKTRGWDDSETWSLDWEIIKFTLPRLERFKELAGGLSYCVNSEEEWNNILDQIIWSFKYIICYRMWDDKLAKKYAKELDFNLKTFEFNDKKLEAIADKNLKKGFKLFHKYLFNLWW